MFPLLNKFFIFHFVSFIPLTDFSVSLCFQQSKKLAIGSCRTTTPSESEDWCITNKLQTLVLGPRTITNSAHFCCQHSVVVVSYSFLVHLLKVVVIKRKCI